MCPDTANVFRTDLLTSKEAVAAGVTAAYSKKKDTHWNCWKEFCEDSGLDPFLLCTKDPIPYLQVFAVRYRDGRLAPGGKPVASKTVSDAVRSVGQRFSGMGAKDPRKDCDGEIDFRLSRQYRSYTKNDGPPN